MRFLFIALFFCVSSLFSACPFCNPEVIDRQLVAETGCSWILYCLTPATEGNLLVIPKRHIVRFEELEEEEMIDLYRLIQNAQEVFQKHYGISDYLIVQKNGKNAGQSVEHIHIHIMPCPDQFDPKTVFVYRPRLTPEEMRECANRLKPYFVNR